ncbi:TIGR03087 family PEP-CTERM/XrtA system glycosyltransferase [Erythrobacter sanguineus]|nr:TIGR03087 family PEP-CTERM/XrtA system glycosyltransferase [Erythrobacter sanguineus]
MDRARARVMGEILFLTHRVPFPPDRGDRIRAHHLLKALARMGPVHVGCFAESAGERAGEADLARLTASYCIAPRTKPLPLAGVEAVVAGKPVSLTAFHSRKLESWVRKCLVDYDMSAIVVFSGQMGQYVPDDFGGRVVIDLCDVDSAKFASYADAGERAWLNRREARLLTREEERLGQRADATLLISEAEAALYRAHLTNPAQVNVQVIGNGINAAFFDPADAAPQPLITSLPGPHFVFTGQMDYRPNEQAALWVIEKLVPKLRQRYSTALFHVVGRNPTARLMARHGLPGVQVWGEVPDVRPFLAAADVVLAPLMIARGVQNKVLEAMAMARPVVLTGDAATGIAAEDGVHWRISPPDAEAMCAMLEPLLASPDGRRRMGIAARRFVLDQHGWEAMLAPLGDLLGLGARGARDAA